MKNDFSSIKQKTRFVKWLFAVYFMYDYINVNFNGKLNPSGKIFLRKKMRYFIGLTNLNSKENKI